MTTSWVVQERVAAHRHSHAPVKHHTLPSEGRHPPIGSLARQRLCGAPMALGEIR